ncbi:MAG: hypothetical protein OD811_03110, partial [Alphaproteobacteria bacterium]
MTEGKNRHKIEIPVFKENKDGSIKEAKKYITLEGGKSIVIIGANGSGKSRLGAYIYGKAKKLKKNPVKVAAQRIVNLVEVDSTWIAYGMGALMRGALSNPMGAFSRYDHGEESGVIFPQSDFDDVLKNLNKDMEEESIEIYR